MLQKWQVPKGKNARDLLAERIGKSGNQWRTRINLTPDAIRPTQDPRRRSTEKMELAIVIETKATMANARMTTITGDPLQQHKKEGQVGFQTQSLCFQ